MSEEKVELKDKELKQVTGGLSSDIPESKYHVNQHLWEYFNITMNYAELIVIRILGYDENHGHYYGVRRVSDNTYSRRYLDQTTNIYDYDPRIK